MKVLLLDTCYLILFINVCSAQNVLDGVYVSGNDSIEHDGRYKPTITGMVTDAVTKEVIQGALVELSAKGQIVKVFSGDKGYFSFSNLDLDDKFLNIHCSKEGYKNEEIKMIGDSGKSFSNMRNIKFQLRKK